MCNFYKIKIFFNNSLFGRRMRDKKEFGFEHNATESRFVANRMSEFLPLILLSKRGVKSVKIQSFLDGLIFKSKNNFYKNLRNISFEL